MLGYLGPTPLHLPPDHEQAAIFAAGVSQNAKNGFCTFFVKKLDRIDHFRTSNARFDDQFELFEQRDAFTSFWCGLRMEQKKEQKKMLAFFQPVVKAGRKTMLGMGLPKSSAR